MIHGFSWQTISVTHGFLKHNLYCIFYLNELQKRLLIVFFLSLIEAHTFKLHKYLKQDLKNRISHR